MKSGRFAGLDRELRAKNEFERSREETTTETVYEDLMLLEATKGLLFLLDRIFSAYRRTASTVDVSEVTTMLTRLEEKINDHIESVNSRLTAIEAGIRRFDNFTLRTYQEVHELKKTVTTVTEVKPVATKETRKRIPKAEVLEEVIEAAKILLKENKRLSMDAVADLTGINYSRIAYACGNTNNLREIAMKAIEEEKMTHGGKNSES